MDQSLNVMKHATLKVDGIYLGQERTSVDRTLRLSGNKGILAWGRYEFVPELPNLSGGEEFHTVVSFSPDWRNDGGGSWLVNSISGNTLEIGDKVLLRTGDSELTILAHLGQPSERYAVEPGFQMLRFINCSVTLDSNSGRVVEFHLQNSVQPFRRATDRPAPMLLDGALAC